MFQRDTRPKGDRFPHGDGISAGNRSPPPWAWRLPSPARRPRAHRRWNPACRQLSAMWPGSDSPGAAARAAVAGGQHSFATVLTCSVLACHPKPFSARGLGDLFVVRVAGAYPPLRRRAASSMPPNTSTFPGRSAISGCNRRRGVSRRRTPRPPEITRTWSASSAMPSLTNLARGRRQPQTDGKSGLRECLRNSRMLFD